MIKLREDNTIDIVKTRQREFSNKEVASQKDLEIKLSNLLREHVQFDGKESLLEDLVSTYQLILKNVRDVIWIMDLNKMKFIYESPSVFDLRGYTPEEAVALSIEETITPESLSMVLEELEKELILDKQEGIDPNRTRYVELENYCKDGSIVVAEATVTFLRDRQHHPIGVLGITRDITERKLTEKMLKQSERKYRKTVLESIEDGYYEVDLYGNFQILNRAICHIAGYSEAELLELNNWELIERQERDVVINTFNEVLTTGESQKVSSYEFTTKNGQKKYLELSITLVKNSRNLPTGFRGIVRDVTDRQLAENELKQSIADLRTSKDELENANIALRVLLRQKEESRKEMEEKIVLNVKELIKPYLEELKGSHLNEHQKSYTRIIEDSLNEIVTPFTRKLTSEYHSLSHKEIQIADLIRQGKGTKLIANMLNMSTRTVDNHRYSIRKKLRINNKKTNLATWLMKFR
ncbi:PAS domain S-box protein [bacterium]|nr:PAS domain S-box protein [bacterium]